MKLRFLSLLLSVVAVMGSLSAQPKYVFVFIGDGMGMGHVMAAQTYNREVLNSDTPLLMMQFPVASQAMTYSYKNPITDSAAAGTALSTGHKTRNGMLGMDHDTISVTSIARHLKDKGYGIGITSSVPIDDATPGSFYAHVPSRKMFDNIIADMANSDYDFFGGGNIHCDKAKAAEVLSPAGYSIYYGIDAYNKSGNEAKKILFSKDPAPAAQIGYTIDSIPGALTLPEVANAAIEHLKRVSPDKFFLMVEGGNIDWAAHSNDGGTVIKEVLNFNKALRYAYDFYLAHPDETLIVVTADHDTGGLTIGVKNGPAKVDYSNIDFQRISKDEFSNYCRGILKNGTEISWNEMKDLLKEKLGMFDNIQISQKQEKELKEEFEEVFVKHNAQENKTLYNSFNGFVEDVFKLLDRKSGFGWTTNNHTGNPVPVYAIGVGAEEFSRISNNIEIPRRIAKLTGVEMK